MPEKELSAEDGFEALLVEAGRAATQAVNSAKYQGPAVEQNALATMRILQVVEALGVRVGELADDFRRTQRDASAAAVGRDFADLSALIDTARDALATPPDELDDRLRQVKGEASKVDTQGVELGPVTRTDTKISLTGVNAARLVEASRRAGVTPVEFATAAVLRAIDTIMGPKL